MSKGSHEVTESVSTRLCEWRGLNGRLVACTLELIPDLRMQILCLLGDILHDLALRCIFRQYDHFLHVVGNLLFRSFVGAVVADILIAFRRILRIVDIVQKCISRICIGCLGRYKSGHDAEAQSLLGIYHFQDPVSLAVPQIPGKYTGTLLPPRR